jgi:hypothetical protein
MLNIPRKFGLQHRSSNLCLPFTLVFPLCLSMYSPCNSVLSITQRITEKTQSYTEIEFCLWVLE